MNAQTPFYSGTSGLVLPVKQSAYPEEFIGASRLTYYASLFSSIEINSSFYQIPKKATLEKWQENVPDSFRFTLKVPKTITHAKGLQFPMEDVERFAEAIEGLHNKQGCLLVQLPPKASSEAREALEGLLECLVEDAKGWKIAVEFRNVSWYNKEVYRMLKHYGAGMVEQDLPKSATPQIAVAEDFSYLRFHGPEGRYRGGYDDAFLKGYAERITRWIKEGKDVYVYFNNTMGDAFKNLQTLNSMVL